MSQLFLRDFKYYLSCYSENVHTAWKRQRWISFLLAGNMYEQTWVNVCKMAATQPRLFINIGLPYYDVFLIELNTFTLLRLETMQSDWLTREQTSLLTYHGPQQLQKACHVFLILFHSRLVWCGRSCVQIGSLNSCWFWDCYFWSWLKPWECIFQFLLRDFRARKTGRVLCFQFHKMQVSSTLFVNYGACYE